MEYLLCRVFRSEKEHVIIKFEKEQNKWQNQVVTVVYTMFMIRMTRLIIVKWIWMRMMQQGSCRDITKNVPIISWMMSMRW